MRIDHGGAGFLGESVSIWPITSDDDSNGEHDTMAPPLIRIFLLAGGNGSQESSPCLPVREQGRISALWGAICDPKRGEEKKDYRDFTISQADKDHVTRCRHPCRVACRAMALLPQASRAFEGIAGR
jgi:hypothetical protein